MPSFELGEAIPSNTAHAVSVSLPTWQSNVGYEEGEEWVVSRMATGYPRFFVHRSIQAFAEQIFSKYGQPGQNIMLFPSPRAANRCLEFISTRLSSPSSARLSVVNFGLDSTQHVPSNLSQLSPTISAVFYASEAQSLAKQYWQHTGDGVSSRRAEFCSNLFNEGFLAPQNQASEASPVNTPRPLKGPRRYHRPGSIDGVMNITRPNGSQATDENANIINESQESIRFLEERFGRNLDVSLVTQARSAIRRRIAGAVSETDAASGQLPVMSPNARGLSNLREEDVYLFPAGMNAIFTTHQALLATRSDLKSVNFGFPYVDTLKILQKFGPGCVFYGNGSDADLDDLEKRLECGERFLAFFCEFPGNPLLKCPDLKRIRQLADEFDFSVVVDETIGTFANINVLPVADIVVSSLTKIFSGDSNVMGGSAILNPNSRHYSSLKVAMETVFEDTYWPEDVVFMERNSRDFASRIVRTNRNAEAICSILRSSPAVKELYYPKHNPSRPNYDAFRLPDAGYGGLLSVVFSSKSRAQVFYDALETAKGPSLGTNFTLCSPYVLLAHYQELPWAAEFGVDPYLVRVSVGLEETDELQRTFKQALHAAETIDINNEEVTNSAE